MSKLSVEFLGAARQVTGSASLIRCGETTILVDYGMLQGGGNDDREANRRPFPIPTDELDAIVLTHAHLDHSGRVPALVAAGYRGPIFAHPATGELAEIIWRDSAHLSQKWDGGPLYEDESVDEAKRLLLPLRYRTKAKVGDVTLRLYDAGHILGSSSVLFEYGGRRVLFSGDVGVPNSPIIRDPNTDWDVDIDTIIIESTYGNRKQKGREETLEEFRQIILRAVEQRGMVLIPAFAIGRTQELLFHFNDMAGEGLLPRVPVLLDSPMAQRVTEVYRAHRECYDEETWDKLQSGDMPMRFKGLREFLSVEDSKRIRGMAAPAIVVAGSGMCTGGRILHHLKDYLGMETTTVVFVGWQGRGTLGRHLVDGGKTARIHGDTYPVKARIETLGGFSAHADRDTLLAWAGKIPGGAKRFLVNHGEEEASHSLAEALRAEGYEAHAPKLGEVVGLV